MSLIETHKSTSQAFLHMLDYELVLYIHMHSGADKQRLTHLRLAVGISQFFTVSEEDTKFTKPKCRRTTLKMFITKKLMRQLNHQHPNEHAQLKLKLAIAQILLTLRD